MPIIPVSCTCTILLFPFCLLFWSLPRGMGHSARVPPSSCALAVTVPAAEFFFVTAGHGVQTDKQWWGETGKCHWSETERAHDIVTAPPITLSRLAWLSLPLVDLSSSTGLVFVIRKRSTGSTVQHPGTFLVLLVSLTVDFSHGMALFGLVLDRLAVGSGLKLGPHVRPVTCRNSITATSATLEKKTKLATLRLFMHIMYQLCIH